MTGIRRTPRDYLWLFDRGRAISLGMSTGLVILMFVAMGLTLLVLFAGLFSMVRGGEFNKKYGNRLMQLRVLFQAIAIAIFAIVLYFGKRG